jgi:hypothetical protein
MFIDQKLFLDDWDEALEEPQPADPPIDVPLDGPVHEGNPLEDAADAAPNDRIAEGEDAAPGDENAAPEALRRRRRCASCYRAAGDRRRGQSVRKVTTSCRHCSKPYCLHHLHLVCQNCSGAAVPAPPSQPVTPRLQQEPLQLEQTVERQQTQITELQQLVRTLVSVLFLVNRLPRLLFLTVFDPGTYCLQLVLMELNQICFQFVK